MKIEKIEQEKRGKASFRLTRRCNNNCPHCYINLPLGAKTEELSAKNWETIIDQLVKNNFGTLSFTGGEIMVYPDFKRIYLYAKKKGLALGLLTNATCFDEEIKSILWKYPPEVVTTTIYGFNKETYATVTGNKKGWEEFSKNMDFLLKLKSEKGTRIDIASIYTKDTLNFLKEIDELGQNYWGRIPVYATSLFSRLYGEPDRNVMIEEKRVKEKGYNLELLQKGGRLESYYFDLKNKQQSVVSSKLFACGAGENNNIYFFEDGTMSFCPLMVQEEYTIKLKQEELENFDYKKAKERLYEKFSPLLKLELNEKCASCELRTMCDSCPAKNLLKGIPINGYDKEVCLKDKIFY